MGTLKPIQLNIELPCTQGWDEMTLNGVGRHCVHCSKTVIDFTTWSDADLINYFSKPNGNVCGRLSSQQLDRELHLPPQPHNRLFSTAVALGCTLLLAVPTSVSAQTEVPQTTETTNKKIPPKYSNTGDTTQAITGRILDETKEPLPNVVVQVYQNDILKGGCVTDYDGNFIVHPLEIGSYDVLVLYTGYDSLRVKNVLVTKEENAVIKPALQMHPKRGIEKLTTYAGLVKPQYAEPTKKRRSK